MISYDTVHGKALAVYDEVYQQFSYKHDQEINMLLASNTSN